MLDQILVMLHPFMPFITEELWHALGARDHDLIVAKWPMADARALDPEAGKEIDWLIRLVSEVRAARTELNVPPGARLPLHVRDAERDDAGAARRAMRRRSRGSRAIDRSRRRRRQAARRRSSSTRRPSSCRSKA